MVSLTSLASERTDLSPEARNHIQMLVGEWTLLADLAFADLVLWLPTWNDGGFIAAAQIRPTTGRTTLPQDMVGTYAPRGREPLLDRALAGRAVVAGRDPAIDGLPATREAIPVWHGERVVAVIARHSDLSRASIGRLEEVYLEAADDLAAMIAEGSFPDSGSVSIAGSPPRAGDGLVRLDDRGLVTFASPNALSALHRIGVTTEIIGASMRSLVARFVRRPGPVDEGLALVTSGRAAGYAEVESANASATIRGIPLRHDGRHVGALILLRDVTDLRSRERDLLTKDATIREIHHRVKNNLQTVAALLRLQARRVDVPEAREALEEAQRRVAAIAVVHESMSYSLDQDVDFDQIADRVVLLVREMSAGVVGQVDVRRTSSFGVLPAQVATPLAMALTELLQNAVEHGLTPAGGGVVTLTARRGDGRLVVDVEDDGVGLDLNSHPERAGRLGLQIVRTLVVDDLGGSFEIHVREPGEPGEGAVRGTRARLDIPVAG